MTTRRYAGRVAVGVLVAAASGCTVSDAGPRPGDTTIAVTPVPVRPTSTGPGISGADTALAAATAYLRAWPAGDALTLCRLTIDAKGVVVPRTAEAERLCVDRLTPHVNSVKAGMAPLAGAAVRQIVVKDSATVVPDLTTVTPEAAKAYAAKLTLVLYQGRWFVRTAP